MASFSRHPGPHHAQGVRATASAGAPGRVAEAGRTARLLAVDLSLGAWRSHQAADELGAQLGLPAPAAPAWRDLYDPSSSPPGGAMGRITDGELQGDRVVHEALRRAAEVRSALEGRPPLRIAVWSPRYGAAWERCDELFVRFLADALRGTPHDLLFVHGGPGDPSLPRGFVVTWSDEPAWPLAGDVAPMCGLVPGTIAKETAAALGGRAGFALHGGCFLVPPELRRRPSDVAIDAYDRLATLPGAPSWLTAYAMCKSRPAVVDPRLLTSSAHREFRAGGAEIALRLLDRAIARARSPAERAASEILRQGIRIVTGRFAAAAELPGPPAHLPPPLRGFLLMTKGWALTMVGQLVTADRCLGEARELLRDCPWLDEYLSLLNISALARLKLGDVDGAFALERAIHDRLAARGRGGWQVRYVNHLNMARLERRRGDMDAAERHYAEAFETTRGSRSDSDAIFLHVCAARLAEQRGRRDDAFVAWSAAALRWASCAVPEAVGTRIVRAIVGDGGDLGPDGVAEALLGRLLVHAPPAGHAVEPIAGAGEAVAGGAPGPTFVHADDATIDPDAPWRGLRGPGAWVLEGPARAAPAIDSPAHRRLRAALGRMLDPRPATGLVIVDDQLGLGLPRTRSELLGVALRLRVAALDVDGRRIALDPAARQALEDRLVVHRGAAVDGIERVDDGSLATFKRYRAPRRLTAPMAGLVEALCETPAPIGALRERSGTFPLVDILRALESERIVDLVPPPDLA